MSRTFILFFCFNYYFDCTQNQTTLISKIIIIFRIVFVFSIDPPPKIEVLPLRVSNQNKPSPSSSSSSYETLSKEKVTKKTSRELTADDYYEIYRKTKEGEKRKGVERKASFSSSTQENRRESSSTNISRSKSFSAYSIKNRQKPDEFVRKSDDRLNVEDQADNCNHENNNMLEQTSQRPPEIKVTGGIAER